MLRGFLASLCLISGCGKVNEAVPVDAPPDADPRSAVHVTVRDVIGNGALAPNIPVVFIDPDGTVVADVVSDAEGRATANVLPGASVSAVYQQLTTQQSVVTTNNVHYLFISILDIKPGDDLPIGFTDRDFSSAGTFDVTFSPPAGMTPAKYEIFTPCGGTSATVPGTVAAPMQNSCKRDSFDILVVAEDAAGKALAGAVATNVSLSAGAATVPAAYTGANSFAAGYTNIPAGVASISTSRSASADLNGFEVGGSCTPAAGACSIPPVQVTTVSAKSVVQTSMSRMVATGAPSQSQTYIQRVGGANLNYALDVGTNLLPFITNVVFDPTTNTITPTVEAPITNADEFIIDSSYSRTATTTDVNGDTVVTNTSIEALAVGGTVGPLTFPTLPSHVGPIYFQPGDAGGTAIGFTIDASGVNGYDAARKQAFDLIDEFSRANGTNDIMRGQIMFASAPAGGSKPSGSGAPASLAPLFLRR